MQLSCKCLLCNVILVALLHIFFSRLISRHYTKYLKFVEIPKILFAAACKITHNSKDDCAAASQIFGISTNLEYFLQLVEISLEKNVCDRTTKITLYSNFII